MGTILRADGTQEEVQPENGVCYQLAQLRRIVGGHIEIVPL